MGNYATSLAPLMSAGHKPSASPETWVIPNVQCTFLEGLRLRDAAEILKAGEERVVAPGETIVQAGDPAAHLYLLKTGRVKYFKLTITGEQVWLRWLVPGDVFGLGTLLKPPQTYMGSAEAMEGCEVFVWEHKRIRALARAHPQLAENALRIVLNYLRGFIDRHVGLITMSAEQRLAALLLNLSDQSGKLSPRGVEIDATNEQLSYLSDMTPFTASRILSKWQRTGTIAKKRGKILVQIPENLVAN